MCSASICACATVEPASSTAKVPDKAKSKAAKKAARQSQINLGLKSGAAQSVLEKRSITDDPLSTAVAVGRNGRFACSGVLIAPNKVLTAKHCLPADQVLFGDGTDESPTLVGSTGSLAHPRLDAAILILESPILAPVQRRREAKDTEDPRGLVRAVGFGAVDRFAQQGSGRKLFVDFIVTSWGCDGDRMRISRCNPRTDFVVASSLGKDTCRGDSGGPVFEIHEDRWRLMAITSRALFQSRLACGEGGIYTRIDALHDWLVRAFDEGSQ